MDKTYRKPKNSNDYSHPLVRSIQEPLQQDHNKIIPSYQPIIPNSQHRISTKIARCTFTGNNIQRGIAIVAAPFDSNRQGLRTISNAGQCGHCGSKMTPFCRLQAHRSRKCYFCSKLSEVGTVWDEYNSYVGYRWVSEQYIVAKQQNKKRVCFIIQCSQYNYQANIHKSLFNVISNLREDNIQIGLILFDDKYAMFINPHNLEVSKVDLENQYDLEWSSIPIIEELFIKPNQCLEQLYSLVHQLLYQAYFIQTTVVNELTRLIARSMTQDIQIINFITTITKKTAASTQSKLTPFKNILNDHKTILSQKLNKQPSQITTQTHLNLTSNSYFYIIPHHITYREAISSCGFTIAKIYNTKDIRDIENELYYDLYEIIRNEDSFRNIDIQVWAQKGVELQMNQHQIYTGFGNLSFSKSKTTEKINKYTINVKRADPSFNLFLKFRVTDSSLATPVIQLHYSLGYQSRRQSYILNITPVQFQSKQSDLESLDDEVIFNHHMRRCLMEWKGDNFKELKEMLIEQYRETVWMLRSNNTSQGISFPKNWKHYMLYSFILQKLISSGKLNSYLIYQLTTSNLELLSKHFYYRAYRIDNGKIKNIKYTASIFQKYTTLFIQNGRYLYLVLTDPSVQEIKDIFGHFDTIPSLAKQYPQLPDLSSNESYRNAVDLIRNNHQHNFLPLKIIDQESYLFAELIEPYLYCKEDHLSFLRKIWRNA